MGYDHITAAIGGAVGGGAGTAVVLATPGEEVRLATGTSVTVKLLEPVTVRLRVDR
jgi:thiamine biosynthesis protein ThiC